MGGSPKPCSKEFQPLLRPRKTGPVAKTSRRVKRGLRVTHRRPQTASTFALVVTARAPADGVHRGTGFAWHAGSAPTSGFFSS